MAVVGSNIEKNKKITGTRNLISSLNIKNSQFGLKDLLNPLIFLIVSICLALWIVPYIGKIFDRRNTAEGIRISIDTLTKKWQTLESINVSNQNELYSELNRKFPDDLTIGNIETNVYNKALSHSLTPLEGEASRSDSNVTIPVNDVKGMEDVTFPEGLKAFLASYSYYGTLDNISVFLDDLVKSDVVVVIDSLSIVPYHESTEDTTATSKNKVDNTKQKSDLWKLSLQLIYYRVSSDIKFNSESTLPQIDYQESLKKLLDENQNQ